MLWGGLSNLVMQLIGVVFGIVLARHLGHADYGMMAMIAVFTAVATALQDSGFKTALANLDHPTDNDYNAVFWFNIIMGATLYALLFVCAPLIGRYYHNTEVVALARFAFLSIIFSSMGTAQSAWLFKNLRAKQQGKAVMAATLVSSITGVSMALAGMAYWSLATQTLVYVAMCTTLYWHYSPWRPSLKIDFAPVRRMFGFSCKILATTIAIQINNNVLNILLGKHYGAPSAGIYNQAYQWNFKAYSLVNGMINQVAQPVLVDLRSEREHQLNALRKLVRVTSLVAFPLLFGLCLVSKEFIVLTIGVKWLPSASLLRLLCIGGAVMPLCTLLSNSVISEGRSGTYFVCTVALCVAQIVTMKVIWPWGIRNMVVGYVALNIVWLFIWFFLVSRQTGYRLRHFLSDTMTFALTAAAVMVGTWFVTRGITTLWLLLAVRFVMAAGLYLLIMRFGAGKEFLLSSK